MADNDHAVVVGVSRYPHLGELKGPKNDVQAVIEWLEDPAGGNVPRRQIHMITSADFPEPEHENRPNRDDVLRLFEPLLSLMPADGQPGPAARRLYIFMTGHGVAPKPREAALLMANARWMLWGHSVSGTQIADDFIVGAQFEEIVLLMDCCRNELALALQHVLPWNRTAGEGGQPTRWLYGFATDFSCAAREQEIEGEHRGVFTVAVLRALRGGAITSKTIEGVVAGYMKDLVGETVQVPVFFSSPHPMDLGPQVAQPNFRISLASVGNAVGPFMVAVGRGDGTPPVRTKGMVAGEVWELALVPGLYEIVREDNGGRELVKIPADDHVEI